MPRNSRRLLAEMRKESPDSALLDYLDARQLFADQKWSESRKVLEAARAGLSQRPDLQMQADMLLASMFQQLGDNDLWLTAVRQKLDANPLDIDCPARLCGSSVQRRAMA